MPVLLKPNKTALKKAKTGITPKIKKRLTTLKQDLTGNEKPPMALKLISIPMKMILLNVMS